MYLLPAEVKLNIYNEDMRTNGIYPFHWLPFLINMGVAIHLGVYMLYCYRVIRRANYTLSAPLLAAPVAFAILNFIYHSMHFAGVSYSSYLCYGVKVALGVCLYTIAYTIYRNGGTIEPAPVKVKYKTSGLDSDTARLLSERILAELQKPDVYLDTTINLKTLAERMNYPPQYISQSVNEHFQVGFPDLLNKIRVEHAKKLLAGTNEKIMSVAYSSGFNNKVSFINAFRKYTDTTPLAYRNSLAGKPAESPVVDYGMDRLENLRPKEA
jgi:AraC-like DNA-binding protein